MINYLVNYNELVIFTVGIYFAQTVMRASELFGDILKKMLCKRSKR